MAGNATTTAGPCRNIGIWVAIASNVGWLLILSYIVSMVHSEYAQLNKDQTKIAATIKTMPDEWHDKSHGLEVNQSTLFHKLFDLQQSMKNLTEDFMQLRAYMQQQQVQVTDVARVALLEKSMADFGADLKSVNSEIDSLKNRSSKFGEAIALNTEAVAYFRGIIVQRGLNDTTAEAGSAANNNRSEAESEEKTRAAIAERQKMINDLNDSVANITAQDVNKAMKNYQEKIAGLESRMASVEKMAETLGQQQQQTQANGLDAAVQRLQPQGAVTPEKVDDKKVTEEKGEANNNANKPEGNGQERNGREGAPIM